MFHNRPWWWPSCSESAPESPCVGSRDDGIVVVRGRGRKREPAGREWKDDVLGSASDRFARTLAEESGKLRIVIAEETGKLRAEIAAETGKLRVLIAEETGKLRILIAELSGRFDARLAEQRAELLKWSFIFWIGQVAAMAALLAFMLRGLPR